MDNSFSNLCNSCPDSYFLTKPVPSSTNYINYVCRPNGYFYTYLNALSNFVKHYSPLFYSPTFYTVDYIHFHVTCHYIVHLNWSNYIKGNSCPTVQIPYSL